MNATHHIKGAKKDNITADVIEYVCLRIRKPALTLQKEKLWNEKPRAKRSYSKKLVVLSPMSPSFPNLPSLK